MELMESRGYSERTINAAIDRARKIPRHIALRRVLRKQAEKRPMTPDYQPYRVSKPYTGDPWSARTPTSMRYFLNHLLQHLGGKGI